MRRTLVVLVLLVAVSAVASGAGANGGNSGAAHACQHNGYRTLHRSDGSSFKNAGACVSYFARGGTGSASGSGSGAGCTVTATRGCLVFDKAVMSEVDAYDYPGWTATVNAAYSFNTSCNDADPNSPCPSDTVNDYATGGGTYVVKDSTGAVIEQGTLTAADTAGADFEGLSFAYYTAADGRTPTSCSAATDRSVTVAGSTGNPSDPYAAAAGFTSSSNPSNNNAGLSVTISGLVFKAQPPTGVTLTC